MKTDPENDYATVQQIRPELRNLALWVLDSERRAKAAFAVVSPEFPAIKIEAETYWNAATLVMSEDEIEVLRSAM